MKRNDSKGKRNPDIEAELAGAAVSACEHPGASGFQRTGTEALDPKILYGSIGGLVTPLGHQDNQPSFSD